MTPTQDSREIVRQALSLLRPMYRSGYEYAKAGVMLGELTDQIGLPADLFEASSKDQFSDDRSTRLMALMDNINRKSRVSIRTARQSGPAAYAMRRERLSPAYTTDWEQLPRVR